MKRIVIAAVLLLAASAWADQSIPLASDADDCQVQCGSVAPAPACPAADCRTGDFNVNAGAVGSPANASDGYLRFQIPTTVLQATVTAVTLTCNGTATGTATIKVYAIATADATTAPETGGSPGTATRTTASVSWTGSTNISATSPDLSAVYNEWKALGGGLTSSPRYMILVLDDDGLTVGNNFYCMDRQNPGYANDNFPTAPNPYPAGNNYTTLNFSFVSGPTATVTSTPTNTSPPATATPLTTPTRLPTFTGGTPPRCGEITH